MADGHAAWLLWGVACAVGLLHVWEVSCHHHFLNNLSVPEQKAVALKTENAFYYSYYEEAVLAPTWSEAVLSGLRDRRSEAPDVINAMHRFNIYQEVVCGFIYRALRAAVGEAWLADPWYFYRGCSYALQGFGHGALVLLVGFFGGGGVRGGLLPAVALFCWLFLHRVAAGRIHDVGMLTLRENWAMPVVMWQVLALQRLIAAHPGLGTGRGYGAWTWTFRVSTVASILLWQFSAFAFILQISAAFLCTLLARSDATRALMADILRSHLMSVAVCVLLLFGNELLLHHMLVTQCLAILAVLTLRPRPPQRRALFWVDGALALAVFGLLRMLQAPFATADEHVGEIMIAKIRKLLPDYFPVEEKPPSFNARLYFAVSVFDFMDWHTIESAFPTRLYHFAGAALLLMAFAFVAHGLLGCRASEQKAKAEEAPPAVGKGQAAKAKAGADLRQRRGKEAAASKPAAPSSGRVAEAAEDDVDRHLVAEAFGYGVFLVQLALFIVLGLFISRLKVLFAPFLCVLAAAAPTPGLARAASAALLPPRRARLRLAVAAATGLAQCGQVALLLRKLPYLEGGAADAHKDFIWPDGERGELYDWLIRNLPEDTNIVTSMPLSAELRLNTPFRSTIHPQYEARSLRDRVQELYQFYLCTPPERMAETMRKYNSSVLILEYKRCDFSPFHSDHYPELNCEKGQRPWRDLLCPRAHTSPHFRLTFASSSFAVLELRSPEKAAKLLAARGGEEWRIEEPRVWRRLLERCLREDREQCISRTAELAVMFLTKMGQQELGNMLLDWVEEHGKENGEAMYTVGRYMDYDLKRTREAGEMYRQASELAPNNPLILREYLMWLDLEAKDERALERFLRPRRYTRGSRKGLLELESPVLACEASVTVKQLLGEEEWSDELWEFAYDEGVGSDCVKTNWQLHHDKAFEESHSPWQFFLDIFVRRKLRSQIVSAAGSGVRFQDPRPPRRWGLQGIFNGTA